MAEPDLALLRARAINEANELVIDREAFADAAAIELIADEVEATGYPDAPEFRALLVEELRARVAVLRGAGPVRVLDAVLRALEDIEPGGSKVFLELLAHDDALAMARERWNGDEGELRAALARIAKQTADFVMPPAND